MIRKTLFSVLALFLILTLGACSTKQTKDQASAKADNSKKTITIGVAMANLPDPFQVSQYYGMVKLAKQHGVKLLLADAGGYPNVSKQVSQLQNFITQKVDAVILVATSPSGTKSIVTKLKDNNIPVINMGAATNGPIVTYVGSSNKQLGEDEAKFMIKSLNGQGNIIMLSGPAGASWSVDRAQAFKDYIKNNSSIKIVKEEWEDSSPTAGLNTMANLLHVYPDVNGVYTASDFIGDGAADAIKSVGKTKNIVVTTAVLEPQTVTYIKNNLIQMTAAQRGVAIGEKALQAALDTINGKQVPKLIEVPDLIVTPDNISKVDMTQIQSPADFKP